MPPNQALNMLARKKTGETSTSGCSRSENVSATATLETAKPYLKATGKLRCAKVSESDITESLLKLKVAH
jgi:hypothetical protein